MTSELIKILLVEDSPSDASLLLENLSQTGGLRFEIAWAQRLEAAFDLLRTSTFDIILLDMSLPDSTGIETLSRAQAQAPHLPIAVLTGSRDEQLGNEAVRRGVQDYLIKGQVDGPQIARSIRYAIERKRAQKALQEAHDLLEQKVKERTDELQRTNRFLEMISACNQEMVHATDECQLIQQVCRIIIQTGGYRMAWVGLAEHDEAHTVRPVVAADSDGGYLDHLTISWADNEFGQGPAGTAIRTGTPCICENILTDPRLAPWRELALQRGFHSSIALPLTAGGRVLGALSLYAAEPAFFTSSQAGLLRGLADDLAFGIAALRAQAEKNRAQAELSKRTEQLRALALELTQAEDRERRRLAQILHDDLQQLLVTARLNLDILRKQSQEQSISETIRRLSELLNQCIQTSRSLATELSPPILAQGELAPALEWLGRSMQEKFQLNVRVEADSLASPEEEQVSTFLFQAVRELLFNVVKHAQVTSAQVRLSLRENDQVQIVVGDQGVGFDPARLQAAGESEIGFGLFSIGERLSQLSGRMEVESAPGRGSRFTLVAPRRKLAKSGRRA